MKQTIFDALEIQVQTTHPPFIGFHFNGDFYVAKEELAEVLLDGEESPQDQLVFWISELSVPSRYLA